MSSSSLRKRSRRPPPEVFIRLGESFEAHATGWGVLVVALVVLALIAAAVLLQKL